MIQKAFQDLCMHIYIYIYIYMCVCVVFNVKPGQKSSAPKL